MKLLFYAIGNCMKPNILEIIYLVSIVLRDIQYAGSREVIFHAILKGQT